MARPKIIKNFDKEDCVHFKWTKKRGCCNRKMRFGVCTVPETNRPFTYRICKTTMDYCQYTRKEG